MLMKHTQVSKEGIVTDPVSKSQLVPRFSTTTDTMTPLLQPLAQLTYGALLSGRVGMVADSSNTAKRVSLLHLVDPVD